MFANSICSYPDRGHYGNSRYRGNCSGHIIKDFVETYRTRQDGLLVDPSVGGGTSKDVATEMGVRFFGTDLHQGFNLLRDDLLTAAGEEANLCFWHPPYWSMINYSGNQWGEPNKWDMSRMELEEFIEALQLSLLNIHDACEEGGHYGILMGNLRKAGSYYNLSSLVERVSPGRLVDEIIKTQHNCVSDQRKYNGRLVRIAHEKLLVFKRKKATSLAFLAVINQRANNMLNITWKAAVRRVLQRGSTMSLAEIYQMMGPFAAMRGNQHWQAKVRQCLQDERYFHRVETGVYTLAA
ncbi:hypothetical protein [Halomonas sp. KO116]|uniref:hypothetical protein n=1 Tax=Halomonas sp. KO116 TaxID=1504981 RepID=UPI0004E3BD43|nr:hypothetical protein [Halomonas sp. KO116]AJY53192.1 hypothetical protein KO116_P200085 [Halomonas sp. KO116]